MLDGSSIASSVSIPHYQVPLLMAMYSVTLGMCAYSMGIECVDLVWPFLLANLCILLVYMVSVMRVASSGVFLLL